MSLLQYKFKLLFAFVLYLAVILIYLHFPSSNGYFLQADEGTYYRQALRINMQGLSAFGDLTDEYRQNQHQEQLFPNPLRVGHILLASLSVYFNNSIASLSYLSLFFFALLCLSVFVFFCKWFDETTATLASCLLCVSPLLCGLSARALSDVDSCFFHTLTLLTFIHYIKVPGNKRFAWFIAAFIINILVKETGIFFVPFYFLIFLYSYYYKKEKAITWLHVLGSLILPGLISGVIVILLIGMPAITAIVEVIIRNNVSKATIIPYVVDYNSGPWYLYVIDYLLLSPLTALMFLFFLGNYLVQQKKEFVISIMLLYVIYFLICYNFLPKNVRYAAPVDVIIRISAILYLIPAIQRVAASAWVKRLTLASMFLLMVLYDYRNYQKFFVDGKIYDPVSYQLLRTEKIIPAR